MSEKTTNNEEQATKMGALTLLKKIFAEKNVPLIPLEGGRLGFCYGKDGENVNIVVSADDQHRNITLCNFCWHEVSKWDIEEMTRLQSNINLCNSYYRCKVVYNFDDDDTMQLSTLMTFLFVPEIPDIEDYFSAQLEDMMQIRDHVLKKDEKDDSVEDDDCSNDNEEGGNV